MGHLARSSHTGHGLRLQLFRLNAGFDLQQRVARRPLFDRAHLVGMFVQHTSDGITLALRRSA
ncbi:MAG: hypothetical protein ACLQB4_05150 [Beijerinckiaceae bacterium]